MENKNNNESVPPIHDMRKQRYRVRNKEEKKGMLDLDIEKKSPAWLNKKKGSLVYQKDSLNKDKKNKSIEDKKFSPQRIKPLEFQLAKNDSKKCCCQSKFGTVSEYQFRKSEQLLEGNAEINKIMYEKQITALQFELDNAVEDKNILINRIETLEMELMLTQKKIIEWKDIQSTYKQNEKHLKERIS